MKSQKHFNRRSFMKTASVAGLGSLIAKTVTAEPNEPNKPDVKKENILKPGDIITEIFIPELPNNTKSTFLKIKERQVWDFALVSLAAVIKKFDNQIKSGKIVFGGVAPIPWMEKSVNQKLAGLN